MEAFAVHLVGSAALQLDLLVARLLQCLQDGSRRDVGEAAGLDANVITQITHPVECVYGEFSPFVTTRDYLAANLKRCTPRTVPRVEGKEVQLVLHPSEPGRHPVREACNGRLLRLPAFHQAQDLGQNGLLPGFGNRHVIFVKGEVFIRE